MDVAGEIRCRADCPLAADVESSEYQLTRIIKGVWEISERYSPAILEVITTVDDPALAIARVEADFHEPRKSPQAAADMSVN